MKTFEYSAVDVRGEVTRGRALATTELEVDRDLETRGLTLVEVRQVRRRQARSVRMGHAELISFTNQLATVLSAGIPIVRGIDDLARRMRTPQARHVLAEVTEDLRAGHSLADAMDRQASTFPDLYRASVRAGQVSGDMPGILRRLSSHLEWARAMKATTIQALVYPSILMLAILGLIITLLTFLLPRITSLFPGGRADLPLETRLVMAASDFVLGNALLLSVALVGTVAAFLALRRHPRGRLFLSRLLLRTPRLGEVVRMLATSRFASTASTLSRAGCDIFTVFLGAGRSCGNAYLQSRFEEASELIRKGKTITQSLERQEGMDPFLIQIANVGEQSGDLDGALEKLADYYDHEVPRTVKWFLSLLEPAILVVSGVVVAFILMAALMPIFSLYDNIT